VLLSETGQHRREENMSKTEARQGSMVKRDVSMLGNVSVLV
jgi:hypothetical protein